MAGSPTSSAAGGCSCSASAIFAVASATCGAAVEPGHAGRSPGSLQGVGEAFAAPASLGLIALLFPDPRERIKALGMWGGIAGLGGTSGTVISGVLIDLASWRWIFFVNLPVALFALVDGAAAGVGEPRWSATRGRPTSPVRSPAPPALIALVDGLLQAADAPVGLGQVLLPLLGGLALLGADRAHRGALGSPLIPL